MNLYNFIVPKDGEDFTTLLEHKNIKINRIVSSADLEPIEYIQDEDEWVVLIEGEATLLIEDEEKVLKKIMAENAKRLFEMEQENEKQ